MPNIEPTLLGPATPTATATGQNTPVKHAAVAAANPALSPLIPPAVPNASLYECHWVIFSLSIKPWGPSNPDSLIIIWQSFITSD